MSECGIVIELSTKESSQALGLIACFQELYAIDRNDVEKVQLAMSNFFGKQFADIIYSELSEKEDVLKYEKYISKSNLNNIEHYMFSLKNKTTNESRLWQDSYSGNVAPKEICPSDITLVTRSRTGKSYPNKLELYYDSDENYSLKAAVFATAFESSGFRIKNLSTCNEYED